MLAQEQYQSVPERYGTALQEGLTEHGDSANVTLRYTAKKGRVLVANKDFCGGQLIFGEHALLECPLHLTDASRKRLATREHAYYHQWRTEPVPGSLREMIDDAASEWIEAQQVAPSKMRSMEKFTFARDGWRQEFESALEEAVFKSKVGDDDIIDIRPMVVEQTCCLEALVDASEQVLLFAQWATWLGIDQVAIRMILVCTHRFEVEAKARRAKSSSSKSKHARVKKNKTKTREFLRIKELLLSYALVPTLPRNTRCIAYEALLYEFLPYKEHCSLVEFRRLLQYLRSAAHVTLCDIDYGDFSHSTGVYPLCSIIEHSCRPNVVLSRHAKSSSLVCRAIGPIKEGEPLTVSYIANDRWLGAPRAERSLQLFERYGFVCRCDSCTWQCDHWRAFRCARCSSSGSVHHLLSRPLSQVDRVQQSRVFRHAWRCAVCKQEADDFDVQQFTDDEECALIARVRSAHSSQRQQDTRCARFLLRLHVGAKNQDDDYQTIIDRQYTLLDGRQAIAGFSIETEPMYRMSPREMLSLDDYLSIRNSTRIHPSHYVLASFLYRGFAREKLRLNAAQVYLWYTDALQAFSRHTQLYDPRRATLLQEIAQCMVMCGELRSAIDILRQSCVIAVKSRGPEHPTTREITRELATCTDSVRLGVAPDRRSLGTTSDDESEDDEDDSLIGDKCRRASREPLVSRTTPVSE